MSFIGDVLLDSRDPPVRAIHVYNANPVAVAPDSRRVRAGFAREDLFCVVHEQFQTDTADYADILLPATSQLEHRDVHKAYGHFYVVDNRPAIAPLGEARSNTAVFRALARRLGFAAAALYESDDAIAAAAFRADDPRVAGLAEGLQAQGWARLALPRATCPSPTAASARPRASASSSPPRSRARASTPCRPGIRPPSRCPATRRWPRAIRSR
jgi:anaerobic selenocysteine-containing dehydrogenase